MAAIESELEFGVGSEPETRIPPIGIAKCWTCTKCLNIVLKQFVGHLINEKEFEAAYHSINNYSAFCFYCDCSQPSVFEVPTKRKTVFRKTLPLKQLATRIRDRNYLGSTKQHILKDSRIVSSGSFIGALGNGKDFSENIQLFDSNDTAIETFQEFAIRAIARNTKKGVLRMSEDTLKTAYKCVLSESLAVVLSKK